MFCRPCGRDHHGPECPVDEQGRPSPAPGLVRFVPGASGPLGPMTVYAGNGTVTFPAAANWVHVTYCAPRPPNDDDGLAGVPALLR